MIEEGWTYIKCELFLYYQEEEESGNYRPRYRGKRTPQLRHNVVIIVAVAAAVWAVRVFEGFTQIIIEGASLLSFRAARRPQRAGSFFYSP